MQQGSARTPPAALSSACRPHLMHSSACCHWLSPGAFARPAGCARRRVMAHEHEQQAGGHATVSKTLGSQSIQHALIGLSNAAPATSCVTEMAGAGHAAMPRPGQPRASKNACKPHARMASRAAWSLHGEPCNTPSRVVYGTRCGCSACHTAAPQGLLLLTPPPCNSRLDCRHMRRPANQLQCLCVQLCRRYSAACHLLPYYNGQQLPAARSCCGSQSIPTGRPACRVLQLQPCNNPKC